MLQYFDQLLIYNKQVNTNVLYCSADAEDVDNFVGRYGNLPHNQYVAKVLENFVANWDSDVTSSLKIMDSKQAHRGIEQLYNGCVMLNPALDTDLWESLIVGEKAQQSSQPDTPIEEIVSPSKFIGLAAYLKERVIGQDEAIDTLYNSLKRTVTGLHDKGRPLGVFLFAGLSGSGKTVLSNHLHDYLFSDYGRLIRIDCGEFQHKHENQKLIGSPNGYVGSEEGGQLTNRLQENNKTVVLFDEVEKAHSDIWNTLLRMFDEGVITDARGVECSVQNAIIIMTTNLGMKDTMENITNSRVGFGASEPGIDDGVKPSQNTLRQNVERAMSDYFSTEFRNRIDKTIVFNPLNKSDIKKIAELELSEVDRKLSEKGVSLLYNDAVVDALTDSGVHAAEGARRVARQRREKVEGVISDAILASDDVTNGSVVDLTYDEAGGYQVNVRKADNNRE